MQTKRNRKILAMEENKKANSGRRASDGTQGSLFKPRLARKKIENVVFEPVWRGKLFQMKAFGAAIASVKFSSKSELSSRFVGRLKFCAV